jgi:hypothetical protein
LQSPSARPRPAERCLQIARDSDAARGAPSLRGAVAFKYHCLQTVAEFPAFLALEPGLTFES